MMKDLTAVAVLFLSVCSSAATTRTAETVPDLVIADFESLDEWRGLELDRQQFKEGRASGLWHKMPERSGVATLTFPHDWSRHSAVSFWMHNARKVDAAFMLILRSENPASDGDDYYSLKLRLDRWTGWRRLVVPFCEFGAAREPLGWDRIERIDFTASGWDNQPHPEAEVRFDDFRVLAIDRVTGPLMSDEELFDALDLARPDMAAVKQAVDRSNPAAAKAAWLEHLRTRTKPVWTVDWRDRPSRDQRDFAAADEVLKHVIQGHDFGPDIDWQADPNNYREWTYAINRFFHWRTLAAAYWEGGDERYAKELCDQWVDWVRKNPVPLFTSGNGSYTWRTIECGIRQSTTWPDCLYRIMGSEHFTPEVAAVVTKSMIEHARHLMVWPTRGGNWLTMESNGLGTIGILLPEMKEAAEWRTTGLARQYAELDNQVYPDGSQIELTTGYHQVSLNNFLGLASTAILNDVPLPGDYYDKLRRKIDRCG